MDWDCLVTQTEKLKVAGSHAYSIIQRDLQNLHQCCHIETTAGYFRQIPVPPGSASGQAEQQCVYVYMHNKHLAFSNVTLTMLEKLCIIEEHKNYVSPCDNHACHESYFPYFYGNNHLQFILDRIMNDAPDTIESLTKITSNELFSATAKFSGDYSEDEWTERLSFCLNHNNINAELTAFLRGSHVKRCWEKKVSIQRVCYFMEHQI